MIKGLRQNVSRVLLRINKVESQIASSNGFANTVIGTGRVRDREIECLVYDIMHIEEVR